MQCSVTIVSGELLKCVNQKGLYQEVLEKNDSQTCNISKCDSRFYAVGIKVNQDFALGCLLTIIINVQELKGLLPETWD